MQDVHLIRDIIEVDNILQPLPLYQLRGSTFHTRCLSSNSHVIDSTGLRIHAGAHVGIKYLQRYIFSKINIIPDGCNACELGCGTGAFGLLGTKIGHHLSLLTISDGNDEAVEIARLNYQQWSNVHDISSNPACIINFASLLWGDEDLTRRFMDNNNQGMKYDVVLGCELMYYRTQMDGLVSTVVHLLHDDGLFIHVHVIRRPNQGDELIAAFDAVDWMTIEVNKELFLHEKELLDHPEWDNVRCLLSGKKSRIEELMAIHGDWEMFRENSYYDGDVSVPLPFSLVDEL